MRGARLGRTVAFLALGAVGAFASSCARGIEQDDLLETAETVLTLQGGTVSALRDRRGAGPFERYETSPERLLAAVEQAARRARARGGKCVVAIFRSNRRGEVVAKERAPEHAEDSSYNAPFVSAMLAVVHSVRDEPNAALLEIHETSRGAFAIGAVRWRHDMPGWIRAELAAADAADAARETPTIE